MSSAGLNSRFVFWISVCFVSFAFFHLFSDICFPFVVGFIAAYLFAPAVESIAKYMNRTLVSFLFALCVVLIFIIAGVELFPRLKESMILLSGKMPEYYSKFIEFFNNVFYSLNISSADLHNFKLEIQQYLDKKVYIFASIVEGIAAKRATIWNFLSSLMIMPLSFFYFLKDWTFIKKNVSECVPMRHRDTLMEVSVIIRKTLKNFLHGQFYVVVALSVYYSISLWGVGIDYHEILGIISGMFSFVPLLGALFSLFLVVFVSVPILTLTKLYIIIAVYFFGQFIEGYVLYPRFVGKKTGLHPLWILFSFFAGVELNGTVGVLIAIPSAAVIRNLLSFAIDKFKTTQAYKQ
jgi:predicted PurR-regulated permease PerM